MEVETQEYRVLYTSSVNKKRKIFQDGKIIIRKQKGCDTYSVTLLNDEGKDVKKSNEKKIDNFQKIGEECMFGNNNNNNNNNIYLLLLIC